MIKELEEYLERRGAKYFVTMLMIFYVVGTVVFNIYLRSLGIYDFEFLQLRYMFSGAIFSLISAIILGIPFLIKKSLVTPKLDEEGHLIQKKNKFSEFFLLCFFMAWTPVYAIYIFPEIPPGFGGAKPILARFVGNMQDIQDINEIIEYETGAENLALEVLNEKSSLAVGANVKILDRNSKRIWIILTKDLYFRSKSHLAKKLLDSGGDVETFEPEEMFEEKPLFVDAKAVKSISFTLYEPPEILTEEDLSVAAYVLAQTDNNPTKHEKETSEIVKQLIQKESPEKAEKFFKAVEKLSKPTSSKIVQEEQVSQIKEILGEALDSQFLNFRADVFTESLHIFDLEKFKGIQKNAREALVKKIKSEMETDFNQPIPESSFLFIALYDTDFPQKISHIFQGAGNAEAIKDRILAQKRTVDVQRIAAEKKQVGAFTAEALTLLEKSSQSNTLENKKAISQMLINHFSSKAPREKGSWLETKYLSQGTSDEIYLDNLKIILKNADSWKTLGENFVHFQELFEKNNPLPTNEFTGSGSSIVE